LSLHAFMGQTLANSVQRAHQREAFAAAWHLRLQRQRKGPSVKRLPTWPTLAPARPPPVEPNRLHPAESACH
jgi:hypothetical protein